MKLILAPGPPECTCDVFFFFFFHKKDDAKRVQKTLNAFSLQEHLSPLRSNCALAQKSKKDLIFPRALLPRRKRMKGSERC